MFFLNFRPLFLQSSLYFSPPSHFETTICTSMATNSGTLAWKISWTEEPGGCSSWGHKEWGMTERLHFHFSVSCIGEGNGNPLQWSCLENPRDEGAWWADVCGVAQSWTRLKWLNSSSNICTSVNILGIFHRSLNSNIFFRVHVWFCKFWNLPPL